MLGLKLIHVSKSGLVQYRISLWISRVVSRVSDGGIPPKLTTFPQILERVGADPPIFDKILYGICIKGPLFSGQSPPFLTYWGGFPPWNLKTGYTPEFLPKPISCKIAFAHDLLISQLPDRFEIWKVHGSDNDLALEMDVMNKCDNAKFEF